MPIFWQPRGARGLPFAGRRCCLHREPKIGTTRSAPWRAGCGRLSPCLCPSARSAAVDRLSRRARRFGRLAPNRRRGARCDGIELLLDLGRRAPAVGALSPTRQRDASGDSRHARSGQYAKRNTRHGERRPRRHLHGTLCLDEGRNNPLCFPVLCFGHAASPLSDPVCVPWTAYTQHVPNAKQKRADVAAGPDLMMERTTGLEPATPTLARLCSTN